MAGRRKLGSASLKTGRLIWPCLAGERGPDGRGKWPYAQDEQDIWKAENGIPLNNAKDMEEWDIEEWGNEVYTG